jgi:hypothetical protein
MYEGDHEDYLTGIEIPPSEPSMETSVMSSAEAGRRPVRPWIGVTQPAVALLTALPRRVRGLLGHPLNRIGTGLQRFDDNLWDGGDEP